MLNFFQSIIQYFTLLWDYVTNLLSGLLNLITAVLTALYIPQAAAGYVFAPLGACILSVLAFSVLKLVIGRTNV